MRYFWWAEFQRRGALHYHGMIVDPPFAGVAEARHWFDAHWRFGPKQSPGAIQAHVEFKSGAWFKDSGADYVMKDARKGHRKAYEQEYDRMPRGWRTFRCHQLAASAKEHEQHETKAWTVSTAAPDATWSSRQHEIWVYRVDRHIPHPDGCRLTPRPTRSSRARESLGSRAGGSASGTNADPAAEITRTQTAGHCRSPGKNAVRACPS